MERTESTKVRFKALNGDTLTEMRVENDKALMYVFDRAGNLLDVLEEVASYIHPEHQGLAK